MKTGTIRLTTLLLLTVLLLKGQEAVTRYKIGVEASPSSSRFNSSAYYGTLVFSRSKHAVVAGAGAYYLRSGQEKPFFSAQAGYRYFPNGTNNRFNLFFEYDFIYTSGNISDSYNYSPYYNYLYPFLREKITYVIDLENYFSFGFRSKLLGRLYMSTQFGAGPGFYKDNYTYRYSNDRVYTGKAGFMFRASTMARITLGCDLIKRKTSSVAVKPIEN